MERQLLNEVERVMRERGISQTDFAAHRKVTRQSVNQLFTGKRALLTDTTRDLLEFLGLEIRLEPARKREG